MHVATLAAEDDFDGWRAAARSPAAAGVPADAVTWRIGDGPADLFDAAPSPPAAAPAGAAAAFSVPRAFLTLAESVVCHSDPERFALLYALLVRLRDRPRAMEDGADPLVRRLEAMAKAVRRDLHKMHAFLRFREIA